MIISSVRFALPCSAVTEVETTCSAITRIAIVGTGAITLLAGILILCRIPGLSTLGTTTGGAFCTTGFLTLLAGACLRCVNEEGQLESESGSHANVEDAQSSNSPLEKLQKNNNSIISSSSAINGDGSIDFAKITPENYEEYLDVSKTLNWDTGKKGDFVFTKRVREESCSDPRWVERWNKGDVYLSGEVQFLEKGWQSGVGLNIRDGKFVHYPQLSKPAVHFENLKDYFDYLFRGDFYQGKSTRKMDFFTLKTVDGREVRYNNPYKK